MKLSELKVNQILKFNETYPRKVHGYLLYTGKYDDGMKCDICHIERKFCHNFLYFDKLEDLKANPYNWFNSQYFIGATCIKIFLNYLDEVKNDSSK